jgi:hypothetical protein
MAAFLRGIIMKRQILVVVAIASVLAATMVAQPIMAQQGKLALRTGQFGMRAGPIWNNGEAKRKCKKACALTWDAGAWVTTEQGKMSICAAKNAAGFNIQDAAGKDAGIEAGPIWNNSEAKAKCKAAVKASKWVKDNWITTEWGKMSMCSCTGKIQSWN